MIDDSLSTRSPVPWAQRRAWLQAIAAVVASPVLHAGSVFAQSGRPWPRQPVQLIVPFPVGGPSAILSKHIAQAFERVTGVPMRLIHQGGSGGLLGAGFAANAPADGHHLFIGGSSLAVTRALDLSDEFDLMEDLKPLAMVATVPQVLVVNPTRMRSRTVMEWLSDVGRKSARFRMATAGLGSSSHIGAEMLKQQESLRFEFVHFKGAGPALQDLLAGSVDMMVDSLISSLPYIRTGRLKALVVSGQQRATVLPDVPCAQEMGISALEAQTWYGLFAPVGISTAQSKVMVSVLERMGQDTQLLASLEAMGIRWGDLYGAAFHAMVKQETLQWAQRIKAAGLKNYWSSNAEDNGT